MLHAGHPPPVRHRLVERVAGRGAAERFAVARAEARDAVLGEQGLGRRQQGEALGLVGRALVGGIEAADALDLVAEEVEPEAGRLAGREQVDQRAADRIFAGLGDRIGALVAERVQLADQLLAVDALTGGDAAGQLADAERGQQALGGGVGGRDEKLRAGSLGLQGIEGCEPLGHHPQRRRGAVVGQAVPRRQGQHLDLGGEQGDGVGERPHRRLVGGDQDRAAAAAMRGPGQVGGQPRQEPGRHAGEGQGFGRAEDALERLARA